MDPGAEHLLTRGDSISNVDSGMKVWPRLSVRMCVISEGSHFGGLRSRMGTCASPSRVDEKGTTGQPVGYYVIGLSEDESESA
jgi:hypothetical protein